VVLVAAVLTAQGSAATFRIDDLDPRLARFAFDVDNLSFASGWVALGSFAAACGWMIVTTRCLPAWLGWWALVSGVGLALCRAVWTSEIWLPPYALFWLWQITVSVLLLRQRILVPVELP
jgi:Domain of unknown function (DUF4386)